MPGSYADGPAAEGGVKVAQRALMGGEQLEARPRDALRRERSGLLARPPSGYHSLTSIEQLFTTHYQVSLPRVRRAALSSISDELPISND